MIVPDDLVMEEACGVFRPAGTVELGEAAEMVRIAITYAKTHDIRRLLVDATGLRGFEPPGRRASLFHAQEFARAAGGLVRVAFVVQSEQVHFVESRAAVSAAFGLGAEVFLAEGAARAWLSEN